MSTEHMEELNDQQIVRREKMAALRDKELILSENALNALQIHKN